MVLQQGIISIKKNNLLVANPTIIKGKNKGNYV